jgi:N-acetylmuramic acid 6-phosphate (MurNAc-6-P) etherase
MSNEERRTDEVAAALDELTAAAARGGTVGVMEYLEIAPTQQREMNHVATIFAQVMGAITAASGGRTNTADLRSALLAMAALTLLLARWGRWK